jgi:inosine-uridine nucleoside N-ribohydrolase
MLYFRKNGIQEYPGQRMERSKNKRTLPLMTSNPTISPPHTRFSSLARLACFPLCVLAALVLVVYIPQSIRGMYTDWQVLSSYPTVKALLPYQVYAILIWSLRYLAVAIFWLAAVLVYVEVGLRKSAHTGIGLFTTLLLLFIPPALLTGQAGAAMYFPPPWDAILTITNLLVAVLGLVGYLLFYYLFPDGNFAPRWMRWISLLVGVAALALLTISMLSPVQAQWIWLAGICTLLAGTLLGIASQLYRHRRMTTPEGRSQTRAVVLALVVIPLSFIAPALLGDSPWAGFSGIFLSTCLLALLPLALVYSILHRGLWEVHLQPFQRQRYALLAAVVLVTWIGGITLASLSSSTGKAGAISLEPLPESEQPRPVVIDTDMAPDDWMAILYLLQRPDIQVQAITIAGTGETHCAPGVRNALGLVKLAGENGIPVACGREIPIQGNQAFPEAWRERADSMAGLSLPEGENPTPQRTAAELLVTTVGGSSDKMLILALGPLTNLADAIQLDAGVLRNVEQIYVMGGALEVLGNVGFSGVEIDNQVAEWNIFVDPTAAKAVFASGAPITLVPLDATNQAPISLDFYFTLQANQHAPEAKFVYDVLTTQLDFIASDMSYFWDPLAAALLADESLGYIKEGNVMVYTDPGPSSGLTRLTSNGYAMRYAKSVDARRFEEEFLRTLNQP